MKVFLVGGAVRDRQLGLPIVEKDWVVVGGTAESLIAEGYKPVGKDFPVFLHPKTAEEYALARTEKQSGQGHKGFTVHAHPDITLEEDLKRRDLTINAIAENDVGELIDPYGGLNDLKQKILRHVSPAFVEDPLRVLRAARFMARFAHLGFTVAPETRELMQTMVENKSLHHLTPERIWKECERALKAPSPVAFLTILRDCGALAVILPEVDQLYGVPQPKDWHPEVDAGRHTELSLAKATELSEDPAVRFAILVHDIGKAQTPKIAWPRHEGCEDIAADLVTDIATRLKLPKIYAQLAYLVAKYNGYCHRADKLMPNTLLNVLERLDAFRRPDRFEQFLIACQADAQGRLGKADIPYPQADVMRQALLAAKRVDIKSLTTDQSMRGDALKAAIRQVRKAAIHTFLNRPSVP